MSKKFVPTTKGLSWRHNGIPRRPLKRVIVISSSYQDFCNYLFKSKRSVINFPVYSISDIKLKDKYDAIELTPECENNPKYTDVLKFAKNKLKEIKKMRCKCKKQHAITPDLLCQKCRKYYNIDNIKIQLRNRSIKTESIEQ